MDTVVKVFLGLVAFVLLWAILGPAVLVLAAVAVVVALAWESRAAARSILAYLAERVFRR